MQVQIQKPNKQSQPFSKAFILPAVLGGLAGLFMEGALHPIDTIRTRVKANTNEVVSLFNQVKTMHKFEGPMSYFRGFTATLSGGFITNASYFYVYEKLKHTFSKNGILSKDASPFAAAFIGGALSDLIALPFEVVRTRMQLEPGSYDYKHFWDGANKVMKREGFRTLYLGGPAFLTLSAIDTSLTFGFYELFYKMLGPYFHAKESEINIPLSIVSSVSAAAIAGFVANPLDVVVMRMQSLNTEIHGNVGATEMIKKIYKKEGFRGFMKGVTGTMSYNAMGALILFPTYEVLKKVTNVDLSK